VILAIRIGAAARLAAGLAVLPGGVLVGQSSSSVTSSGGVPGWLESWSPLLSRGSLVRHQPNVGLGVATLFLPAPRLGSFWFAGNPAGLVGELQDSRSDFGVTLAKRTGTYHRPLDPAGSNLKQATALAWRPLTPRFALLGRVVLDQERFDPGTSADLVEPYPSSPFVTIDTSSSATRRTRVRLEGVGSWRMGDLDLGLSLGLETLANETIEAGFARRSRFTTPAAKLGFSYLLGSVRLGGYGGWRHRAETLRLIEIAAQGQAIELQGHHEVPNTDIIGNYYRRFEENTPTAGVSLSGRWGQTAWTLYGERTWVRERSFRQETDDPVTNRWHSNGWASGLALQRSLSNRMLLTIDGRFARLNGDADLGLDSAGAVFRARERALIGSTELRVALDSTHWGLVVAARVGHENRVREDLTDSLSTRISSLTIGVSVELARSLSTRVSMTGTLAYANYSATSAYPAPGVLGQTYRTIILPELDFMARQSRPYQGALGLRWRTRPGTFLWVVVRGDRLVPVGNNPTPFGPNGSRSTISATVGVTMQ
jgi:hypothetical protein